MYHLQLTRIARTSFRPVILNPFFSRAYTAAGDAAPNLKAKNSNEHEKNPDCVARGLKAAIHNPKVSTEAKDHASQQLKEMDDAQKETQKQSELNHARHQLAGYKAALSNKRTSEKAKKRAQSFLDEVGSGKNEKRVLGGYKAALKNRFTSDEAKTHVEQKLKEHGAL